MKKILYKIEKFWDLWIGPFFINGQMQEHYFQLMRKKYGVEDESNNK